MATVVNIQPNDPWAGFGQAFAQSMQQKKELENKKALMDYAQELEQKKYSADAAILASIPATQQANKVAAKAEQDLLTQDSKALADSIITPGMDFIAQAIDMGGQGISRPEAYMKGQPPVKATTQNMVKQTPGQIQAQTEENARKAQTAKIEAWKAKLAAKGQVVMKDPTTGQMIVTNAKDAAGLDAIGMNRIQAKLQIDNTLLELNKKKREAIEAGEETVYKAQRIKDITAALMGQERFASLFEKPEDRNDPALVGRMAKEIYEKNDDFATFALSLEAKSEVYVDPNMAWGDMKPKDYSVIPRPGLIKFSDRIKRDKLLHEKDPTTKTVGQKNADFFVKIGIDPKKVSAFAPNTPNNVAAGNWREFLGVGEKDSKLSKRVKETFPIGSEAGGTSGYTDPSAKMLFTTLQAGLGGDTQRILDKSLLAGKVSGYHKFDLVEYDKAFAVLKDIYVEESKAIARLPYKSEEYKKRVNDFNEKYKKGGFLKEALNKLGIEDYPLPEEDPGITSLPRAAVEATFTKVKKRLEEQGVNPANTADPIMQNIAKGARTLFKNDPKAREYFFDIAAKNGFILID